MALWFRIRRNRTEARTTHLAKGSDSAQKQGFGQLVRVIQNSVDRTRFAPVAEGDIAGLCKELGIPVDVFLLLDVGDSYGARTWIFYLRCGTNCTCIIAPSWQDGYFRVTGIP